jgi:hypothetical protein
MKKVFKFVMWSDFPGVLTCIFYIFALFTPGRQPYFEISEMTTHPKYTVTHARGRWWTSDFANVFLSPGLNSRAELVFPGFKLQGGIFLQIISFKHEPFNFRINPGCLNTAEKRLRMYQIMKIWRGIWISISKTKTCLLIGQKLVKQARKYSKWVD